jgi:3-isopropylmalate dehydrogenase
MKIIIIPGDGIGPETMSVTSQALETVSKKYNLGIEFEQEIAGHASLEKYGSTVTSVLLEKVKAADGLMLGPMSTYDFKDEHKGEINPSKFFRKELDLFANIRPARTYNKVPTCVKPFDLAVVRENTEGFYADRNIESGSSEMLITPDVAISLRRITRECCERIARSAFELAMTRKKHVTIVHKANVLKIGDGIFIDVCRQVGQNYPEVTIDDFIVDAMMAHVVRAPERFDTIVTTNMFGDILSDLTAELSGSLGLGGSLNAGMQYAMGQAAHGSAPDIAGKDIANPFSLILSGAMLLNWYGQKSKKIEFMNASKAIENGVSQLIDMGHVTKDIGGKLGTRAVGEYFIKQLNA